MHGMHTLEMLWSSAETPTRSGRGRVVGQKAFLEEGFVLSAAEHGEISLEGRMGKDDSNQQLPYVPGS